MSADGFIEVGFDKLSSFEYETPDEVAQSKDPARKPKNQIPPEVRALNLARVALKGFMLPLTAEGPYRRNSSIMRDQSTCCYGVVPKINQWVDVRMPKGVRTIMDRVVTAYGTLRWANTRRRLPRGNLPKWRGSGLWARRIDFAVPSRPRTGRLLEIEDSVPAKGKGGTSDTIPPPRTVSDRALSIRSLGHPLDRERGVHFRKVHVQRAARRRIHENLCIACLQIGKRMPGRGKVPAGCHCGEVHSRGIAAYEAHRVAHAIPPPVRRRADPVGWGRAKISVSGVDNRPRKDP